MAHTYYNYLAYLHPDADVNLAVLKDSLEKLYETAAAQPLISVSQQQLTLTLQAYNFYITFSDAPHVQQEAQEFADEYELDWNEEPFDEQKLRACKVVLRYGQTRMRIWIILMIVYSLWRLSPHLTEPLHLA